MLSQFTQQKKWRDAISVFIVFLVLVYSFRIFSTDYFLVFFYILTALFILLLKKEFGLYTLALFLSSFAGALVFSAKSGFSEGYFSLLSPIISLGLAASLYFIRNDKKYPRIIVTIAVAILMIALTFDRFSDVNYLDALRGSKNHLITYALSLWFLAVYFFREKLNFGVSLVFLVSLFFAATLSTSLGAMVVAVLGFYYYLFFKNKMAFIIVVIFVFLFLYNISFHTFDWVFQTKLVEKFYRGSVRALIWQQFFSDFSVYDVFIGRFESFSIDIKGYSYENLHSSFFLGASKYGYIFIIFQYLVGILLLFSKRIGLLLKTFVFMILVRSLYDTMLFSYGYIDWIFYLLLFHLDASKNTEHLTAHQGFCKTVNTKGSA